MWSLILMVFAGLSSNSMCIDTGCEVLCDLAVDLVQCAHILFNCCTDFICHGNTTHTSQFGTLVECHIQILHDFGCQYR